jgi:hypothetical protein
MNSFYVHATTAAKITVVIPLAVERMFDRWDFGGFVDLPGPFNPPFPGFWLRSRTKTVGKKQGYLIVTKV